MEMEMVDGWLLRRLFYPHGNLPPVPFRRRPSGSQFLSGGFEKREKVVVYAGNFTLNCFCSHIAALVTDIEGGIVVRDVLVAG
jgi:hypothetical protein